MRRTYLFLACMLAGVWMTGLVRADETITVSAQSSDISEQLNLQAVANLFAQCRDLEEFEQKLNDPEASFTNLDLNGDGQVDYLRVIETMADSRHLIVLQSVLAKDVFQDVATIYVEKDETTGQITTQIIGDERIYGVNYIIEPVFYYRPVIYDWFWGPTWVCWYSPFYWGYYPHWWHPYYCCPTVVYVDRCRCHNYASRGCSFRRGREVCHGAREMQRRDMGARTDISPRRSEVAARTDMAVRRSEAATAVNQRAASTQRVATPVSSSARSNTFGSMTRQSSTRTASTTARTTQSGTTTARTTQSSTTTARTTQSSTTTTGRTYTSSTPTRSSSSTTTARTSSSPTTATRSSSSTYSGSTRSSSTYSGSSYSGSTRSSGSGSTYSGGSYSGSTRSSGGGGYSGGGYSGGGRTSSGGGRR